MIKKVLEYVRKYQMIQQKDTIVAGISGGADSVCLLFVLLEIQKQIPFSIEVAHIDHGIREDAAQDARFVKMLCEELDIPFHLTEENVRERAHAHGVSEEEEGRLVRYQAFEKALGNRIGKIAVAHNSNDRAETMLFHLFRGTGLTGMSGIRPVNGKVIRPLLCLGRDEIETYLGERGISFCQDSTNGEDVYTRNRIRHHILAYAQEKICRAAVANMGRAADQLLCAEEYIEKQTKLALAKCVQAYEGQITIKLPGFFSEDKYIRGRMLLECISEAAGSRKDITAAHVAGVEALFKGTGSKELYLPYGVKVYKEYDLGKIQKEDRKERRPLSDCGEVMGYEVSFPSTLEVPGLGRAEFSVFARKDPQNIPEKTYTKWFDYDKITSSVVFRTRRPGDYLTINDKMGHKSLQDYFVNEKIPRESRGKIFLLAEGSHVIWLPGHRISEFYKIREDTRTILQVKIVDREG